MYNGRQEQMGKNHGCAQFTIGSRYLVKMDFFPKHAWIVHKTEFLREHKHLKGRTDTKTAQCSKCWLLNAVVFPQILAQVLKALYIINLNMQWEFNNTHVERTTQNILSQTAFSSEKSFAWIVLRSIKWLIIKVKQPTNQKFILGTASKLQILNYCKWDDGTPPSDLASFIEIHTSKVVVMVISWLYHVKDLLQHSPWQLFVPKKDTGKGATAAARSQAQRTRSVLADGRTCVSKPEGHSFTCSQQIYPGGWRDTNTYVPPPSLHLDPG